MQVHKKASLLASPVASPSSLVQGQLTTAWAPCGTLRKWMEKPKNMNWSKSNSLVWPESLQTGGDTHKEPPFRARSFSSRGGGEGVWGAHGLNEPKNRPNRPEGKTKQTEKKGAGVRGRGVVLAERRWPKSRNRRTLDRKAAFRNGLSKHVRSCL